MISSASFLDSLCSWRKAFLLSAALTGAGGGQPATASTPVFQSVHEFNGQDAVVTGPGGHGPSSDGNTPYGRLLRTTDGTLYTTTCKGGARYDGGIFSFTPPSATHPSWIEKTVYWLGSAGHDGFCPIGGVIPSGKGGLYGTAAGGGPYEKLGQQGPAGIVFELVPPSSGKGEWRERIIYAFKLKSLGWVPNSTPLRDRYGALYGLVAIGGAHGSGGIYKLTPPTVSATAWTETLIYSFAPTDSSDQIVDAPLIMDSSGALYSRDPEYGSKHNGAIIKLTPPTAMGHAWTMDVLYKFAGDADGAKPLGGVIFGAKGTLLGTTSAGGNNNAGTIFSLTPPVAGNTAWTHNILYAYPDNNGLSGPVASPVRGKGGTLYIANESGDNGSGSLSQLTPPVAGTTRWTARVLHHFTQQRDGGNPVSGPVVDENGVLYGTASFGGKYETGTLYQLTP